MRIGIDIRLIGKKRTGDEAVFFNLTKNLALIDNQNEYLLFTDILDANVLQDIKLQLGIQNKPNFEIISLKCPNKFVWNFWILPNYLRKNPVDIYLTQYITPFFVPKKVHPHTKNTGLFGYFKNVFIKWRIKHFGVGVKIITIIHDISFKVYPQHIKFLDLFFLRILIPLSLRRADKIVGVSNFTKDEIVKYYSISPDKVSWIHNAVPDNFHREISAEKIEAVRKKYNLPEKFILYIGTLQPRKNLPFLIEAFAGIREKIPGLKLVLAGNRKAHNFDKKIDEAIKRLNLEKEIIFPGFVDEDDKPEIFRAAHVFVFPSLYEGFGIPVIEAMSQGVPVLASDIPSLREVAGSSALFFNLARLADCQEKLYTISIDEKTRKNLVDLGYARIQFFSWRKTAEKMLDIYKSLI